MQGLGIRFLKCGTWGSRQLAKREQEEGKHVQKSADEYPKLQNKGIVNMPFHFSPPHLGNVFKN